MPENMLKRTRITQGMHSLRHSPVLLLTAPMGYGKSTAVRHYLQEYALDNVWVSALHDNDTMVWEKVCSAIASRRKKLGKILHDIGFPVVRYFIPRIIESLKLGVRKPLIIVFDDCQLLAEDSPLYHVIFALAMEQITNLRIICISRSVPGWFLTEMRTKELCSVITADTLAFDQQETFAYLQLRLGLSVVNTQQTEKILDVSEGWIAAIVLLAEGLLQGHPVASSGGIHLLFEHTLFQGLQETERVLLAKLAILNEFTLAQAESVVESPQVIPLIQRLCAQNAFIMHDNASGTYKMHTLLRSFVEQHPIASSIDKRKIVLNLARWEYAQGQYDMAFKRYYQCGHSIEFFERITTEERMHITFAYKDIYYEVFKSLPMDTALRFPLMYTYISLYFLASGVRERERFALKCLAYLRRHFVYGEYPHPQRDRVISELEVVLHLSQFNDPFKTFDSRRCTNKALLRDIIAPVSSTVSLSAGLPSLLYCHFCTHGKLDALIAFAEEHFDCDSLGHVGYGFEKLLHAEKHLERMDLKQARFYANQAIHKGWLHEQIYIVACAYTVLMRISLLECNFREAIEHLDIIKFKILDKLPFTPSHNVLRTYALMSELCEIIIYSFMHDTEHMSLFFDNIHNFDHIYVYRGLGMPMLFKIKYKIIKGEFAEAEVLCDYYEREFVRYPVQLGILRNKIFRAVINFHLYGIDAARALFCEALEEAAVDNILALFAENAALILPLFEFVKPTDRLSKDFLHKVHEACQRQDAQLKHLRAPAGSRILTRREVEVFQLMAQGLSQKNIAAALGIRFHTVRRHLDKIYFKLEVNNRVAALNKGHALGF